MLLEVLKKLRWLWTQVLELIYPPFCVLCDSVLAHGTEEILCHSCQVSYPFLEKELCAVCSKPLQDKNKARCLDCRKRVHFYEEGKALWVYEDAVKAAVKSYKYSNRRELGILFAKGLVRHYNRTTEWPIDLVVPVPLHLKRLRQRGFNQTQLMAKHFAADTHLPLSLSSLTRIVPTLAQEGLSEKDRMLNVREAFKADEAQVNGKNILLIDDVYTTGATIDGCAKALADAGAANIYFMTVAIGRGY